MQIGYVTQTTVMGLPGTVVYEPPLTVVVVASRESSPAAVLSEPQGEGGASKKKLVYLFEGDIMYRLSAELEEERMPGL